MASPPPKPSLRLLILGRDARRPKLRRRSPRRRPTPCRRRRAYRLCRRRPAAPRSSRPLDEEPVPASADQTLRSWSPRARWPRLLEGEPPGCDHDALACGEGVWTGLPASAGSIAIMLGSVMTAMRSPGSLASSLANGFSSVRLSEFNRIAAAAAGKAHGQGCQEPRADQADAVSPCQTRAQLRATLKVRALFRRGAQRLRRSHDQREHHIGALPQIRRGSLDRRPAR